MCCYSNRTFSFVRRNGLVGLVAGYIISIIFTVSGVADMVDFSNIGKTIDQVGYFSIPKLVFLTDHRPVFNLGAFFTIAIVYLVSAAETTGATTAVCTGALNRDIKMEELQGSLAVDAFPSAVGDIFNGNAVAGVFVVSLLLSLFLPKKNKK